MHGIIFVKLQDLIHCMNRISFKRRTGRAAVWSATALALMTSGMWSSASADISVFTSAAPAEVEKKLAAEFTETTGNRVRLTVGTVKEIQDRLFGLEKPDLVVLPAAALDALDNAAGARAGSRIELARVGIGIVVREGAPLPDISSVDALRKTLLAARSIAHPDPLGGGFAGVQITRMFARLGIADALRPKVRLAYAFTGGVAQIASGDAEIGLFNISEILPVKGVTLVGPLIPELQSYITFSGALHAGTAAPEPATSFLRWLSDPKTRDVWRTGGFELLGGG
jgi:molybdate transport system substrate-binding protein